MLIKEILTIDLSEDIKNVIDLEDASETEIKSEIENYIVTDGLAKEFSDFVNTYTSNIKESGVWLSGFYGSGKSYFSKLTGYMLSNRSIAGTPARDRILQRFTGINDEALVRNTLGRLNSINTRVIALDIAKQNTDKGFAFTLFRNFLKSLDLPENEHGYLLYQILINQNQPFIYDLIDQSIGIQWGDIKNRILEYSKAAKNLYLRLGNNENEYKEILTTIRREIDGFSAAKLRDELTNYLQLVKDEKIVFMFDEASEAISKDKITLLDLEGISEALSSLGSRVWTIAIAQEKLDDVIRSARLDKSKLTKLTDRFKTKIHLEATEVDYIIRNRLLGKNDDGLRILRDHYQKNSGKISDHAALIGSGIAKTDNVDNFTTYYPFYKYHFDLLQNFLFGTKGYASTKVAARGMIITTYDILKRELQNNNLFEVATGWQIAKEAQQQPHVRLVSRYDNAERILKEAGVDISGRRLLETINFLSEAEVVPTTVVNIVKSFTKEPEDYHRTLEKVSKALDLLTDARMILDTNKTYRITSDIEQRLLDEMLGYTVQGFIKKKQLVSTYKTSALVKSLSRIQENSQLFDFFITTDNDDELTNPSLKSLKLRIKSIYNISDNRSADIETLKFHHQNDKDLIWLVPDNTNFRELDKLIDEIERISYLEQKYSNPNSDEGKIILSFSTAKVEKQARVKDLIDISLSEGTSIYLYTTLQLSRENWQNVLQQQQKQLIQNVYYKRLSAQLSDNVAASVIKEANNTRLKHYFSHADFHFFDAQGNFIGENLKVVEEITHKIRHTFVDGATIEKDLEIPPTGYTYGTIVSTLAALMRANKVLAKYNGAEKFSWKDDGVAAIFSAATQFRKASFKAVNKSLTAAQKLEMAQFLIDMEAERIIGRKIDFNINDFDLVNAIRDLAKYYGDKVTNLRNMEKDFDKLFPLIEVQREFLLQHTGAVSESNYIDKAIGFLSGKDDYLNAIQAIEKVEKFIRNSLPKAKEWKSFTQAVNDELKKAALTNQAIETYAAEFFKQYHADVVKNFMFLQLTAQKIKDEYHKIFSDAMRVSAAYYVELKKEASSLLEEIANLPENLNNSAKEKANNICQYASQRTQSEIELSFDVKDNKSRFTLSEVLSFIELYPSKNIDLELLKSGLVKEAPQKVTNADSEKPVQKIYHVNLPGKKLKVVAYKSWLQLELKKLANAADNDEIEIN